MPYLLDNLDAVRENLTRTPFGLITDVDGTISEIAPSPALAKASPECRKQLRKLVTELALVAAVSGRPSIEVKNMVGIEGMVYVGNHGLERWQDGNLILNEGLESYKERISTVRKELEGLLSIKGLAIEDKGVAIAVHYRNCPNVSTVRDTILNKVADSKSGGDFQIIEGKMVVELRPSVNINKGSAIKDLINEYKLEGGLYLGDDSSDLDAFRVMHKPGFCAVGVVADETPDEVLREAEFTLNGVPDVARFLKWLAVTVPELKH